MQFTHTATVGYTVLTTNRLSLRYILFPNNLLHDDVLIMIT